MCSYFLLVDNIIITTSNKNNNIGDGGQCTTAIFAYKNKKKKLQ